MLNQQQQLGNYNGIMESLLIQSDKNQWFWYLLFVLLFLGVAWARYSFPKRSKNLINSFFSNNSLQLLYKEEKIYLHPFFLVLNINAVISSSLFIYQTTSYFVGVNFNLISFLVLILLLMMTLYYRPINYAIVSWVFRLDQSLAQKEMKSGLYYFQILGLVLLVLNLVIVFGSSFLVKGAIILGFISSSILYLRALSKIVNGALKINVSPVFLILYLCTFEISPLVIIVGIIARL